MGCQHLTNRWERNGCGQGGTSSGAGTYVAPPVVVQIRAVEVMGHGGSRDGGALGVTFPVRRGRGRERPGGRQGAEPVPMLKQGKKGPPGGTVRKGEKNHDRCERPLKLGHMGTSEHMHNAHCPPSALPANPSTKDEPKEGACQCAKRLQATPAKTRKKATTRRG